MAVRKILFLKGLSELERLDSSSAPASCRYVVERCRLRLERKPMVSQVEDATRPTTIIRVSPQFVAVCQLKKGETAPSHLPKVSWASL